MTAREGSRYGRWDLATNVTNFRLTSDDLASLDMIRDVRGYATRTEALRYAIELAKEFNLAMRSYSTRDESQLGNKVLDLLQEGYTPREDDQEKLEPGQFRRSVEIDFEASEPVFSVEWREAR